ncbi:MAG: type III secretion inner membrane ring lipoprotein SctJ [Pseudomonadota bacterium]
MRMIALLRQRGLALMCALLMLAGCQEVLYSELSEEDANEMVALLVLSGIPAKRERDSATTYAVSVEEADLAVAVTVLKNSGLPREKFTSLGEVFGDSGVVGTPFEERARFAFATNEELANTISQIKGIERARVHVVVPAEDRFGKPERPARASVAIFHDTSFDPSSYSGRIKTLVAFAVPGLEVEQVAMSYFLTPGFVVQPLREQPAPGAAMADGSIGLSSLASQIGRLPLLEIGVFFVVLILLRLIFRSGRRKQASRGSR